MGDCLDYRIGRLRWIWKNGVVRWGWRVGRNASRGGLTAVEVERMLFHPETAVVKTTERGDTERYEVHGLTVDGSMVVHVEVDRDCTWFLVRKTRRRG